MASSAFEAPAALVTEAIDSARGAAAGWRGTPHAERCEHLRALARGIEERHIELAAVVSLETGKTRTESILEVQEAVDLITTYADLMEENDGYRRPLASFVEDERNADHLRPYGVFAVISPFNFPAALSINMASAALIAGNTVVFKPSEETPWTGAILGEIARAAELPAGVSTWCMAVRKPVARWSTAAWTAWPLPARRRLGGRSPGRCRRVPTPAPPSPRWAARTRRS